MCNERSCTLIHTSHLLSNSQIACMQMLPREVILGIVLVDLPINLDRADSAVRKGFGSSWWYLACECDDYYSSIVEEVVSFCSFPQVRALSLFANDSHDVLLERATPKCKMILNRYLRFVGRFEFVDSTPIYSDGALGVDAYKAMDFGTQTEPYSEGRSVVLKCFTSEESFLFEVSIDFTCIRDRQMHVTYALSFRRPF